MVVATSGGAPAPWVAPAVVAQVGLLLEASNWRGRSWRGGLMARARQLWRLGFGPNFAWDRALFIGVLVPNRRR
jgi:hypothetical protein